MVDGFERVHVSVYSVLCHQQMAVGFVILSVVAFNLSISGNKMGCFVKSNRRVVIYILALKMSRHAVFVVLYRPSTFIVPSAIAAVVEQDFVREGCHSITLESAFWG